MANLLSTTVTGSLSVNVDSSGSSISTVNNGNASRWYGRITTFNSTSDKSVFLGTYASVAVVGAHNNALTAWANLYVNNVDGVNGGNVYLPTNSYVANNSIIHSGGGQTIGGTTYFSGGESLNLYGIRGRFTNEYIHLYEKVGIGHPAGWGQGQAETPTQGLSTYGGMNIAYGNGANSYINGYLRINKNWAGGDFGAEQLTIRGTYPSIALRSTQHNSKWLIHHASALQFYYGGTSDDNNWANKFEIPTDGNIWMAWANANISTLLDAKQNASTAITTSNIGSQSVASAGSATTAANANHLNTTRDTPSDSLQYWQAPGLGLDEAPSTDWHNTIRMGHGSPLSYYSNTLAIRMTGSGVGDIYTQTIMNGTRQGWKKHWNDSNLTNLNQLTNGPGYITGYTETDTLATVVSRGNSTGGGRPITFDNGGGAIITRASAGGWAMGTYYQGSAGTTLAGFGAYGGNDSLTYAWIGAAYDSSWMTINPSSAIFRTYAADTRYNIRVTGGDQFNAYLSDAATTLYLQYHGGSGGTLNVGNGKFIVNTSGDGTASASLRAPIFYDSDDTGFYVDPNGTSNLRKFSEFTMAYNGMNPRSANSPYVDRYNGSAGYRNGTMGFANTDFNVIARNWGSGFIDTWSSPANAPGSSSHYIGLQGVHYSDGGTSFYGFQMACAGEADNRFFWRSSWPNMRSWVEMIHSGNIGSQSVASAGNSTNLDGRSSSRYLYYRGINAASDFQTYQSSEGIIRFDQVNDYNTHSNPPGGYNYGGVLSMRGDNFGFQIWGSHIGDLYYKTQWGNDQYSGWRYIVHSGNIGSQSVNYASSAGNADTVDNYHETAFVRLAANSSSPTNGTFAIGSASSRNFIQSHSGQPLDINPLGNAVTVGASLRVSDAVISTSKFIYSASVSNDSGFGLFFDNSGESGYAIYREAGAWNFPYPDLRIAFHTGIKLGANASYNGIRFYTDTDMATQVMSVNNGSDPLGGGNVYVNNSLQAGSSLRAPIFYDSNDTGYYGDFAGFSRMSEIGVTNHYVYNYDSIESGRINNDFGVVGKYVASRSAAADWPSFSFEHVYGNHSWGIMARFHIRQSGADRPSIQFSSGSSNTRWNIGYCFADDNFRISQNMGYRPDNTGVSDGWGTARLIMNTSGVVDVPQGYVSNGNPWGTSNSAFFPNGITTAGGTNWIYGTTTYIGNAPGNGAGHDFSSSGHQYSTGSITTPLFLVNSHSDNTKGYRIHNTSGSSVSAMFTNSANALVIGAGAFDQVQLNKKVLVSGAALGVNVAASATAGRIDASNDIVAYSSSDERLKHNITPIENALDKVKSLTGVEFDWKPEYKHAHGYEGHDTGIIAQQVQEVIPSAVRTNDTGFLAVRYEKLIGLLVEGMKEQQAQIDELKAKLDGLTK
jgi:hypothetical protein